ncbi:uncharacterized protein LOC107041895 [Diachasma alloeum]|uniref:uncharacterized protein LOC107041895 n=1 Tax=Diachasma alloeum TaxID=454923 RepID=UPI0007382819|nr:uncharacterized protein LOC107041895 [Diachasma alloeum]
MDFKYLLVVTVFMMTARGSQSNLLTLVHDLVQNNVAGIPIIHEKTEWDFDPNDGKIRRVQYEAVNGWRGQDLINRLGGSAGFKGPWGTKVQQAKPDLRHVR